MGLGGVGVLSFFFFRSPFHGSLNNTMIHACRVLMSSNTSSSQVDQEVSRTLMRPSPLPVPGLSPEGTRHPGAGSGVLSIGA